MYLCLNLKSHSPHWLSAPLASRMAASADRIATIKKEITIINKEIDRHKSVLNKLYGELYQIEALPAYLVDITETLTKHFGENSEWINTITEAIKTNLDCIPLCELDNSIDRHRCSYTWNTTDISYYVYCWHDEDIYLEGGEEDDGDDVRINCIYTYTEKKWDNFKDFDLKYIPILIAYMKNDLVGIDNTYGVYKT